MEAPTPAFELDDVSRRYGRRWALARVSFRLEAGQSLLLTGHNGSGKSTLLRVLATALRPTLGRVRVGGLDAVEEQAAVRTRVALLAHSSFLYEDLSAEQNLLLLARLLGVETPRSAVDEMLERVGLAARRNHPVRQYSAGMRKRLAIARLLLKRPALALLDEPFGELDPAGIQAMEGHIRALGAAGTAVVLATHLVEQGQTLCTQRLHLVEGRVTAP